MDVAIQTHGLTRRFGELTAVDDLDLQGAKRVHLWLPGSQRMW